MSASPLIEIKDLRIRFHGDDGRVTNAVDSVDLSVANGATLGLVGESGCGKSVTMLSVLRLIPPSSRVETSGQVLFDGHDLLQASNREIRRISRRICAWIVTSSAVVGSSAISTAGSQASAIAIITRWRMPPESLCGYSSIRRSGEGM